MDIEAVNTLAGQRAALEAPPAERNRVFREQVWEPLRPMMDRSMAYSPGFPQLDGSDESVVNTARAMNFFVPAEGFDIEKGLEAISVLERAGTWEACQESLAQAIEALRPQEHGVDLDRVLLSLVLANPADPNFVSRNYSYTGIGNVPGYVLVMVWPTEYNVPRLPATVTHEFNHNVRFLYEPWSMQTTVGQYIVAEGLGETFAEQICGEERLGPWSRALDEAQTAHARARIGEAIDVTGFNEIRGYIFGDWAANQYGYKAQGLADFAGYTIGYNAVRAYLHRTGRTAAEATYVPWREIVEESGYFA